MNWKKVSRYLVWFLYTLMTGSLLMGLCGLLCVRIGLAAYWGVPVAAIYAAVVGGVVYLLSRGAPGISFFVERNRSLFLVLEATVAVTLLAVGLLFRIPGVAGADQWAVYYEMAEVTMGREIPQIAHGAVYVYLQVLHAVLTLFGNYFAAGIWVQIVLQLAASVLVFFVVRRQAGSVAALTTLGFSMCAPYVVQNSLLLSPEMLYFFFLAVVVALFSTLRGKKWNTALLFFMGILIALCCYLDVCGILLLIPAAAVILGSRREAGTTKKAVAGMLCLGGVCLGFLGCTILDSLMSGKEFWSVLGAWLQLYRPQGFRIPAVVGNSGSGLEGIVLVGLMTFGIFSFWREPKKTRMTVCMVAVCCILLAGCYGIFTNEMPGYFYLYLLFVVLAGVGLGQCFYVAAPELGAEEEKLRAEERELKADERRPGTEKGELRADERRPRAEARRPGTEKGELRADERELRAEARKLGTGKREPRSEERKPGTEKRKPRSEERGRARELAGSWPKGLTMTLEDSGKAASGGLEESGKIAEEDNCGKADAAKPIKYIENPLPLPKKHVKRVLDYALDYAVEGEDYDYTIAADDDFDI